MNKPKDAAEVIGIVVRGWFEKLDAEGLTTGQVAAVLGVSEASVSHWKDLLQKYGAAGLEEHKASGRPPGLSEKDKKALLKKLQKGARAAGFETERWTQARVQQVIEREFGVTYHSNYISRLLHSKTV